MGLNPGLIMCVVISEATCFYLVKVLNPTHKSTILSHLQLRWLRSWKGRRRTTVSNSQSPDLRINHFTLAQALYECAMSNVYTRFNYNIVCRPTVYSLYILYLHLSERDVEHYISYIHTRYYIHTDNHIYMIIYIYIHRGNVYLCIIIVMVRGVSTASILFPAIITGQTENK